MPSLSPLIPLAWGPTKVILYWQISWQRRCSEPCQQNFFIFYLGCLQQLHSSKFLWKLQWQNYNFKKVQCKFLMFFCIVIVALNSLRNCKQSTRFSGESCFLLLFVLVKLFEILKLGVVAKLSEFEIFRINKTLSFDFIM